MLLTLHAVVVQLGGKRRFDLFHRSRKDNSGFAARDALNRKATILQPELNLNDIGIGHAKREPNSSGLSQLRYMGEARSCWEAMSACKSASCSDVRLNTRLKPSSWMFAAIRPVSFSRLARGECEPGIIAFLLSLISAVTRSVGCWANEATGKGKRGKTHPASKSPPRIHILSKVRIFVPGCLRRPVVPTGCLSIPFHGFESRRSHLGLQGGLTVPPTLAQVRSSVPEEPTMSLGAVLFAGTPSS